MNAKEFASRSLFRSFPSAAPVVLLVALAGLSACGARPAGERGTEIISAREALALLQSNTAAVLVDARPAMDYNREHIARAVNVPRAEIIVNTPFPGTLAPAEQVERVMGSRGISSQTLVIAYDNANGMDAARLWWTLKVYGHHNVKVVSGGFNALTAAGATLTAEVPNAVPAVYTTQPADESMMIRSTDIRNRLDNPDPKVFVIDTRTIEEHNAGTIPGAIHLDYVGNLFADTTFRPPQQIRIRYLQEGIDYDDSVVVFCQTSIRASQTYLALYNAGYRAIRLYDGAWVEWSANPMNPVFVPPQAGGVVPSTDAS